MRRDTERGGAGEGDRRGCVVRGGGGDKKKEYCEERRWWEKRRLGRTRGRQGGGRWRKGRLGIQEVVLVRREWKGQGKDGKEKCG